MSDADVYEYFLDNEMADGHQSLIFGLRELDLSEMNSFCLNRSTNTSVPITDKPFYFSSDYGIRVYTSGCYYLDENNQWKSDGLKVSFVLHLLRRRNELHLLSLGWIEDEYESD